MRAVVGVPTSDAGTYAEVSRETVRIDPWGVDGKGILPAPAQSLHSTDDCKNLATAILDTTPGRRAWPFSHKEHVVI